jgi:hypothetical protein
VLYQKKLNFKAIARSSVGILLLPLSFFVANSDIIDGIETAMIAADEFIEKFEFPKYDYKLFNKPLLLKMISHSNQNTTRKSISVRKVSSEKALRNLIPSKESEQLHSHTLSLQGSSRGLNINDLMKKTRLSVSMQ